MVTKHSANKTILWKISHPLYQRIYLRDFHIYYPHQQGNDNYNYHPE